MATDYYPQEEGAVFDSNSYIIPCYPDGAIAEMQSVKPGTTVAGRISVLASAATGDSIGIALRAATGAGVPSRIPILFRGLAKVTSAAVAGYYLKLGSYVMNFVTGTTYWGMQTTTWANLKAAGGAGASYILGLAVQGITAGSGSGDEVLILVGKTV